MANSAPTAILADSITSFHKSALKTLKDLEKQLAQADTNLCNAQKERDNALRLNHASQLQLEAQKLEALKSEASLGEAELTIEHQAEIIAQLQRDVNHWKEQARNWQEHFTHVEEERCSLSTKLDEILTAQPIIPHIIAEIETPISTSSMKRTSTTNYFPNSKKYITDKSKSAIHSPESESPAPDRKRKVTGIRQAGTQQGSKPVGATKARKSNVHTPKTMPKESPDPPLSRLVRRVQAVIQVKSEDERQDLNMPLSDGAFSDEDNEQDATAQITGSKRNITRKKNKQVTHDKEEWLPDGGKLQPMRPPSKGGHSAASDDDDELMLGGEDTRNTPQAVLTPPSTGVPPNKRRKLNNATNMTRQKSKRG